MAASNLITHERLNQVDEIINQLQQSANAVQDSQKHELASCFQYIEQLSEFEDYYTFW